MTFAITLEAIVMCLFSLLFAYFIYTIKRFISKDDEHKEKVWKYLKEVDDREKLCLQRFVTKEEFNKYHK